MAPSTSDDNDPVLSTLTEAISGLPARFMLDPDTYRSQADRGYQGIDFYFTGRGGPLGDVPGDVVAAAMVFFEPGFTAASWDRGRGVQSPAEAGAAFAACLVRWSEAHLPDGPDYPALAELLGRVTRAANPAGAPLFAAWRLLPEPEASPALALHRLNLLRELQGALHGAAVLAAGLTPHQAMSVRTPALAGLFGWGEPLADTVALQPRWDQAQDATRAAMGRALAVLEASERAALAELLTAAAPT